MSATTKTTITIQNIKKRSDELKKKRLQAEYADATAKAELEGVLDRISALTREDLGDRELDLIWEFLDGVEKLESSLDAETCVRLIETCQLFKHRVLFFAEQSRHNIAKLAANDLRVRCIELLTALDDSADTDKIPNGFESMSPERLLKVCRDIDTAGKERMYACVQNLIDALNGLREKREYGKEKYEVFRNALLGIGIVYSPEANRFFCKYDKARTMIALEDPVDCLLPSPGRYVLDSERDRAEAELMAAWDGFIKEHASYRRKYNSKISESSRLDAMEYHAQALDRRIEVQCGHCIEKIQAVKNPSVAQLDLLEWLKLEYFLETRILPYHDAMKERFREGMLDLLIELEAALDKPRGENTEQELKELLEKILQVRAPVVTKLLSEERVALQAEDRSVELGESELAAQESAFKQLTGALEDTSKRLSLQETKSEGQSIEYAKVVAELAEKQETLKEVQTEVSRVAGEKSALEKAQEDNKQRNAVLEAKVQREREKVQADAVAYEKAHASLQLYDKVLPELGEGDGGVQRVLAKLEQDIANLEGAHSANKPATVPNGFTEFSDHLEYWNNVDVDVSGIVLQELDSDGYGKFITESDRLNEVLSQKASFFNFEQSRLGEIPAIFRNLQSQLDASSQTIKQKELERLKSDVLQDIEALTAQHTHLAEKSTGFFSSISRAFRSNTTKDLANQLAVIKTVLSEKDADEDTILVQIQAFKELLGNENFRNSGSTDGEHSRKAHMDYLHFRWRHEGKNALNIYVDSAVKPIREAMQTCNQVKKELQKARDDEGLEVGNLKAKLDASEQTLADTEVERKALVEKLEKTDGMIKELSGQEGEAQQESKKLETAIKDLEDEEERLRLEIKSAEEATKILQGDQSVQLEKVAEAEKALAQKRDEVEPRREDVENRKRALETAYIMLGCFDKPYLLIAESEQLEAPSAPQSISEIKKRILELERDNQTAAMLILGAIDQFLEDDTFNQETVFTSDETYAKDDLYNLKKKMGEMYLILDKQHKHKDFDAFYQCAYYQLKEHKRVVDEYSGECPNNEVMKALAGNFPDYVEQLEEIRKNNVELADLKERLLTVEREQQKAAEATQKMLERESLKEKMRLDALREQEKLDALRGETKMEKSEEMKQRQTITPHKVQELPSPLPSTMSKGAQVFSTQQVPQGIKTGGYDPRFLSGSSHQQNVEPTSRPIYTNVHKK